MTLPESKLSAAQEKALQRIDYLHLVIVSAGASPGHLPYLLDHPDIDQRIFAHHLTSLSCLMQLHLQDLAVAVVNGEKSGHIGDFRMLVADTALRLHAGAAEQATIHQHLRNLFAFDAPVRSDVINEQGGFIAMPVSYYALAVDWLLDTLGRMERGETMFEILGGAQNSEVCTRLCFADALSTLQLWQHDMRLIVPGNSTVM